MPGGPVMAAIATAPVAGWWGKLASLGDFASRRLAPAFIARWDGWLQQVMPAARAELGAGWLDAYLSCPVWRFIEWPQPVAGTAKDAADESSCAALHAGILLPSVDKVGRYFPLCVAAALPALPIGSQHWQRLEAWLDALEAAALCTLDTRFGVQQFDAALHALPLPACSAAPPLGPARRRRLLAALRDGASPAQLDVRDVAASGSAAALLDELAAQALAGAAAGCSLWWSRQAAAGRMPLLGCRGLPDAALFATMLRAAAALQPLRDDDAAVAN